MSDRTDVGASALRAGGTARMTPCDHSNNSGQFLAFVECAGCGEAFPVRSRLGMNRAKWCSERCRKAQYAGQCVDCGAPTNGHNGRGPQAPKRCRDCHLAILVAENVEAASLYRKDVEALWAEGKTAREIGALMGWTTAQSGAVISGMRSRGYHLPYRHPGMARWHAAHPETMQHARSMR